mgnify:CR=1 FL=1
MPQILKIASWNINSVRARIDLVTRFLQEEAPDILCLQEIKVADDRFPLNDIRKLGFDHVALKRFSMCVLTCEPSPRMKRPFDCTCRSCPTFASCMGLRGNAMAIAVAFDSLLHS